MIYLKNSFYVLKIKMKDKKIHKINKKIPALFLNFLDETGLNKLIPLGVNKSNIIWLIIPRNIAKKV